MTEANITFPLRGGSYRQNLTEADWAELKIGQPVFLVCDPCGKITGDRHTDATAVAVYDFKNRHIGYAPKEQAAIFGPFLMEGKIRVTAKISWYCGKSNLHINCTLSEIQPGEEPTATC